MTHSESPNIDWHANLRVPPPSVIEEALDELRIRAGERREVAGKSLFAHAQAYSASRYLEAVWNSPHRVRADMEAAAAELEGVLNRLERLPPEFDLPFRTAFSEQAAPGWVNWEQLLAGMGLLKSLTDKLGNLSPPKRPADRTLKNSVGGLMLLLERLTGNRATVRARRDGHEPELVSVEARVIGRLLRSVDPRLQTITLVNTISSIRRASRGKSLDAYSHQLLLGGTVTPH